VGVVVHEDQAQVAVEHKFLEVSLQQVVLEVQAKLNLDFYELTKKGE
jgi:hypothetical protein